MNHDSTSICIINYIYSIYYNILYTYLIPSRILSLKAHYPSHIKSSRKVWGAMVHLGLKESIRLTQVESAAGGALEMPRGLARG